MELDIDRPMILDGAIESNIFPDGISKDSCRERMLLDNSESLLDLMRRYVHAGSDSIIAPTNGANGLLLSKFGMRNKVYDINSRIMELAKRAANGEASVGGAIAPVYISEDQGGAKDILEIIAAYEEQIDCLKAAGADYIFAESFVSISQMKAALLAANQAGMKAYLTMRVDVDGNTALGSNLLSAAISLPPMGAAAIGLTCSSGANDMAANIKKVSPYSRVPLIAKPSAAISEDRSGADPYEFAESMYKTLNAGASIIGGCCGSGPEHIAALIKMTDSLPIGPLPETEDVEAVCTEGEAFFLNSDFILDAEPIVCGPDIEEDFINIEREGGNAALIRITYDSDVLELCDNAYMSRLPIAVFPDNFESLELTLLNFGGRLIIDSRCNLDKQKLTELAGKYGALIV